MAEKSDPVDVTQLAKRDLSETAFPGGGKPDFRVFFERTIHQRIAAHAAERLSLEICGVLVGHWHRDADGPFVLVEESIRCDKALSNAGDVTFTHDAWREVHQQMDTKFTDRDMVGWYHSHPNFGIFLSDRDCFIQDHFFNGPGQIAYVVDPVNGIEGVFNWRGGKSTLCPHFWVGDEIHLSSQGAARKPSSASPAGQPPPSTPQATAWPPLSSWLAGLLGGLSLLLLGYLVGSRYSDWERNMLVRGVVAHYGLFKGLKPGMREKLDEVDDHMQKITQAVDTLAKEHISSLPADAQEEKKKLWTEVERALVGTIMDLRRINDAYSLTPQEAAEVQQLINAKQAEEENLQVQTAKDSAARSSGQKTTAEPAKTTAARPPANTAKPAATNKKP